LKLDSPEDAIGIMIERMNVGKSDMVGAIEDFFKMVEEQNQLSGLTFRIVLWYN